MITANFFRPGKRLLVVGAGCSGLAALRLAASHGCQLALSDGGRLEDLASADQDWLVAHGVSTEFGGHGLTTFLAAQVIIVSPGVPLTLPALQAAAADNIPIISELEFASLFVAAPIIAVTGTNGKTTVTTLIGHILREGGYRVFVGGNIGTPLSALVVGQEEVDVVLLEVSSFQLDTAYSFHPQVAVLLGISPDHLERYQSFSHYADSKMGIFRAQQDDDWAIINGDDEEIRKRQGLISAQVVEFSPAAAGEGERLEMKIKGQKEEFLLPQALQGQPNRANCQAAILAARYFGCSAAAITKGLAAYTPLAHRQVLVAEINGVRFVDDSKATNIGAVISALQGMTEPVILLAGGRDKGGDYRLLIPYLRQVVRKMVVMGEAALLLQETLAAEVDIVEAKSLGAAVRWAAQEARPGETVLLSPACASFDMFTSYQQRGLCFQSEVRALGSKGCLTVPQCCNDVGEAA